MHGRHGVGMSIQIALPRHARTVGSTDGFLQRLRGPGLALLMVLSLGLAWSWLSSSDNLAAVDPVNPLVHWQDAAHDWLLVVDPATRELVVYDANDGRPLKRLGAADGLPEIESIVQQGSWLFVMGARHPKVRLLKLPELKALALDAS